MRASGGLHCCLRCSQVLDGKGWGFLAEDKSEPHFAFKLMDTVPWERARGACCWGWGVGNKLFWFIVLSSEPLLKRVRKGPAGCEDTFFVVAQK